MEGLELICFEIITNVGAAKSSYMEAIMNAKEGKFDEALKAIETGDTYQQEGHKAHFKLIGDEDLKPNLLLVHAEDQLMSAETMKALALEVIDLYKKIATL